MDVLAKWLDVPKKVLHKTLRESYSINQDYMVTAKPKRVSGKYGGNNHKEVLITADCMKRLCMRSRSAKAETVRTYFIEIEDFLFRYNDQIVDGLMRDIQNMQEENIKKKKPDGPGMVYFFLAAEEVIKPGSASDMAKRLATYNTGRVEDVELLHVYKTDYRKEVERCLKKLMVEKQYKKRRELYEVDPDIVKKLIRGCANLSMKLHYKGPSKGKSIVNGKYYMIFTTDIPVQ